LLRPHCSPMGLCHVAQFENRWRVRSEKNGGFSSPGCGIVLEKSIDEALSRGGVPVLSLVSWNPSLSRDSLRELAAGRPSPPDSVASLPMKIRPRSEVPVVRITAGAGMNPWLAVFTPAILVHAPSVSKPITRSSRTTRLDCEDMTVCIRLAYSFLSHCARVARTAGPRLRFNVFS